MSGGGGKPSATYMLFRAAIQREKQVTCVYQGLYRELCPHIIGRTDGVEKVLAYQFAGKSKGKLPNWRCLVLAEAAMPSCAMETGTKEASIGPSRRA